MKFIKPSAKVEYLECLDIVLVMSHRDERDDKANIETARYTDDDFGLGL